LDFVHRLSYTRCPVIGKWPSTSKMAVFKKIANKILIMYLL
jgi:hypothetical protein